MKQYTCPECGKTWQNISPDTCPECGCPSSHFVVKEEIYNNNTDILYKCPDCGNTTENNQSDCPICGCPKELLTKETKRQSKYINDKKIKGLVITIILVIIALVSGLSIRDAIREKQAEEHRQQQEQYERNAREQERRRIEREEEEAKREYEQERNNLLNKVVGYWVSEHISSPGYGYTGYYYFTLQLNRSMNYELYLYESYSNRLVDHSSGKYEAIPASKRDNYLGNLIINPKIDNAVATVYSGSKLEFRGYNFTKR